MSILDKQEKLKRQVEKYFPRFYVYLDFPEGKEIFKTPFVLIREVSISSNINTADNGSQPESYQYLFSVVDKYKNHENDRRQTKKFVYEQGDIILKKLDARWKQIDLKRDVINDDKKAIGFVAFIETNTK